MAVAMDLWRIAVISDWGSAEGSIATAGWSTWRLALIPMSTSVVGTAGAVAAEVRCDACRFFSVAEIKWACCEAFLACCGAKFFCCEAKKVGKSRGVKSIRGFSHSTSAPA